jgi:hypothetical protein
VELKDNGLRRIREAVALLEQKATPEDVEAYRRFVASLAERVAGAKGEGDADKISDAEREAIAEIEAALAGGSPAQAG